MPSRADWTTTWMAMADAVAKRSKCTRRQIGAVIVSSENFNNWIGYNGPPASWKLQGNLGTSCEMWCDRAKFMQPSPDYDNCITIHAEANALLKSDPVLRKNGTIYVTSFPCWSCAKMIANSGIRKIVTRLDEEADAHRLPHRTIEMLADSGLEVGIYGRV
jgi:dCMP deaminase